MASLLINRLIADLLQVAETNCIKLGDKMSRQSTCIKPVDNLQQTCNRQGRASDANCSRLAATCAFSSCVLCAQNVCIGLWYTILSWSRLGIISIIDF